MQSPAVFLPFRAMVFRVALLLAALGGAVAAPGQGVGAPKRIASGVVTGHVYLADTNGPARLATVLLQPAASIDGYTASGDKAVSSHLDGVQTLPDGSFELHHVAPGTYYVFASASGYVSPLATIAASRDQLDKPDKDMKAQIAKAVPRITVQPNLPASIEITLERGAAVNGTVLYDDGSPAAGLEVQVLVRHKDKWELPKAGPINETLSTNTDDRGMFRISGLPAREYLLGVNMQLIRSSYDVNGGSMSLSNSADAISIYSGDKLRPQEGIPFVLKAGEERPGEDINVPLAKLHRVSGTIVAAKDGHVINSGNVRLLHSDDRSEAASVRLGTGDTSWTMSFVPEGTYVVQVSDAADVEFSEVANAPGSMPASFTRSNTLHHYGQGEMPLEVKGDVSGVAVAVPEPGAKTAHAAQ